MSIVQTVYEEGNVNKQPAPTEEQIRQMTEELERRVKKEGLDLDHPEGKERFEELLKRASKRVGT